MPELPCSTDCTWIRVKASLRFVGVFLLTFTPTIFYLWGEFETPWYVSLGVSTSFGLLVPAGFNASKKFRKTLQVMFPLLGTGFGLLMSFVFITWLLIRSPLSGVIVNIKIMTKLGMFEGASSSVTTYINNLEYYARVIHHLMLGIPLVAYLQAVIFTVYYSSKPEVTEPALDLHEYGRKVFTQISTLVIGLFIGIAGMIFCLEGFTFSLVLMASENEMPEPTSLIRLIFFLLFTLLFILLTPMQHKVRSFCQRLLSANTPLPVPTSQPNPSAQAANPNNSAGNAFRNNSSSAQPSVRSINPVPQSQKQTQAQQVANKQIPPQKQVKAHPAPQVPCTGIQKPQGFSFFKS